MTTVCEVRYDDESYSVVARFTDRASAQRLRDRLFEAHTAADKDDCHLDDAWQVVEVEIDDTDPEIALPTDLFDFAPPNYPDGGHASVNIDSFPLAFRASLA